jgi:gliding motility-associated-like protein
VLLAPSTNIAQCFEIESILVDACGNPEGENEMVRFTVGGTALNTSDLSVGWATTMNSWLGVCQNATTAQKTAALNATITTCGFLKEPTNGVLPAGSKVLLITSTDIDVTFNSFDGLNDTLYIIYQCAGNTAGHFGNHGSSATRTLSMSFANPAGCTDVVSYDRSLLINQMGTVGGSSADRDGGGVNFTNNGVATYYNNGCQAPIITNNISITATPTTICPLDTISLTATSSSSNIIWLGGLGTFSNPTSLNTSYYSSSNDIFPLTLYAGYIIPCGDTIVDSVTITQSTSSNLAVTTSATSICAGETITLSATGANSYNWHDGSTGSTVNIDTAGTFYVSTNACGNDTAFVTINWNGTAPNVSLSGDSLICQGETTLITATGDGPFTWHDNSIGSLHNASSPQTVYASVSNNCGTDTAYMTISLSGTPPTASISGDLFICNNIPTTLTANGGDSYTWNDGTTSSTYSSLATTGFLVANNNCGTDTLHFTVNDLGTSPTATISGDSIICDNEFNRFEASGGDSYTWHNGTTNDFYYSSSSETIYVIAYNQCGADTAYFTVDDQSVLSEFEVSDSVGYQPLRINFTNLSQNATNYLWDLGNEMSSSNEHEDYTYTSTGEFIIQLIASNPYCSDTSYKQLTILNSSNVFIPNTFSPNNDFINDLFTPIVSDISEEDYDFTIFDRNGQIIFNSTIVGESWDGTHLNTKLPNGVYIWKLNYKTIGDLTPYEKYGHINLIR